MLLSVSLCSALQKNSHTPSYQTRSLPSLSMEKSKHNYRMQLFKYCDIWSLAGTKSACNERLGYKDWEDTERISAACPHPSTKHTHTHTHSIVLIVYLASLRAALRNGHTCRNSAHTQRLLLSPLHRPQSWQANMAIRESEQKHYLHKPCVNKHDIEWWFFKRNFYQKEGRVI